MMMDMGAQIASALAAKKKLTPEQEAQMRAMMQKQQMPMPEKDMQRAMSRPPMKRR